MGLLTQALPNIGFSVNLTTATMWCQTIFRVTYSVMVPYNVGISLDWVRKWTSLKWPLIKCHLQKNTVNTRLHKWEKYLKGLFNTLLNYIFQTQLHYAFRTQLDYALNTMALCLEHSPQVYSLFCWVASNQHYFDRAKLLWNRDAERRKISQKILQHCIIPKVNLTTIVLSSLALGVGLLWPALHNQREK